MKMRLLTVSAFALFSLPAFAQEPSKPDIVILSRQSVESSAKACSELLAAFENGSVLIKELQSENDQQRLLIQLQIRQIKTLELANAKIEEANIALLSANETLKKALALAEEQHAKDAVMIAGQKKRRGKRGIVLAILRIAGIGGATAVCGPYCGIGAAVGMEAVPVLLRK